MANPFLGEYYSTSSPDWLSTAMRFIVRKRVKDQQILGEAV
jgi:hypothetical protein